MSEVETTQGADGRRVLRKVVLTLTTGGFTYLLTEVTNMADRVDVILALILSAFIGGLTLVVQFLTDFDSRVTAVEGRVAAGFTRVSEATELFGRVEASRLRADAVTQLVQHATKLDRQATPLAFDLAQSEISRWTDFLKQLSNGDIVTYEGEDRDWILGLARNVTSSIDATSLTTVDAGGEGFVDGGLWMSDLGQRYLEVQRDAIRRGVKVRRVFILDKPELVNDPNFTRAWQLQKDIGVEVRVLEGASAIPGLRKSSLFDFVLFDDAISYETIPATRIEDRVKPTILNTRLELRRNRVEERIERFRELWDSAHPLE